ncbi:MAG TPA: hypothetical protein VHI11_10960 [Jiangellaceae bacterium]|nr:hypothetical protein [Jiangellaceae bacterium]
MLRGVVIGLGIVLALTGCGSTDEERVEAALLRLSDFPADDGWEIEPETTDPSAADFEAELERDLDRCEQQHDPTVDVRTAERDSDSFVLGDLVVVGSNASVVSERDVRDELFLALPALVDCAGSALEEVIGAAAGEGVRVRVSDPSELAVSTDAERTGGQSIQLGTDVGSSFFVDVIAVEQGPTLLYVSFIHQGELGLADEEQIIAPAVKRLQEL